MLELDLISQLRRPSALIVCSFARRWQRHSVDIERGRADQVVIGNVERYNCADCRLGGSGASMVSDLDIWRAAQLPIRKHSANAELEAARLQDLMLDRGDDGGWLVWQRIRRAIEALRAPPSGEPKLSPVGAEVQMSAFPMNGRSALAVETALLAPHLPLPYPSGAAQLGGLLSFPIFLPCDAPV
jgi:hypothetical protein